MSTLPLLYDRWMTELLGETVAPEPQSSCSTCAMCAGGGTGQRPASRFVLRPDLKCCTYTPLLPNYLIGGILGSEGPHADAAHRSIRERIAGGVEVTPMGLGLAAEQTGLDASLTNVTGMHEAQRCPHLVLTDEPGGTACSIWAHRDAVCATWWCRFERGAVGVRFWWSLRYLFRGMEYALALWCCLEDELDPAAMFLLMGREGIPRGATTGNEVTREQFWGGARGEEEAFYRRCHERVQRLDWADVLRIGGPTVQALARYVQDTRARLDAPIPERLALGPYTVTRSDDTGAAVETYSVYDPIGVPQALLPLLHLFDGRPLAEVEAQLSEDHGVRLDPRYLRALVDYGVLVAGGTA